MTSSSSLPPPAVKRQNRALTDDFLAIAPLSASHVPVVAKLLHDVFAFDNYSWGKALGKTSSDGLLQYLQGMHLPPLPDNGMGSLVAFARRSVVSGDADSAETRDEMALVGALTIDPMEERFDPNKKKKKKRKTEETSPGGGGEEDEEDESRNPIAAIMNTANVLFWDHLDKKTAGGKPVGCHEIAYFAFLGVEGIARRLGVGARLVREAEEHLTSPKLRVAKSRNEQPDAWRALPRVRVGAAFCTSPKSRDLFGKEGFEVVNTIEYSKFEMDGMGTPFASLPDGLYVMVKWYT